MRGREKGKVGEGEGEKRKVGEPEGREDYSVTSISHVGAQCRISIYHRP